MPAKGSLLDRRLAALVAPSTEGAGPAMAPAPPKPFERLNLTGAALDQHRACYFEEGGGVYGGPGDRLCTFKSQPDRMAFLETRGLTLAGAKHYPVLKEARAPEVEVSTLLNVRSGLETWRDESDASFTVRVFLRGPSLVIRARVLDDDFLGTAGGDSFGLRLGTDPHRVMVRAAPFVPLGTTRQFGPVLRQQASAGRRTFEEIGRWRRHGSGADVEFRIPLRNLLKELGSPATLEQLAFSLEYSDADAKQDRPSVIGVDGTLSFWSSYPPSPEEFVKTLRPSSD